MKRVLKGISVLLTFALAASLVGCGKTDKVDVESQILPTVSSQVSSADNSFVTSSEIISSAVSTADVSAEPATLEQELLKRRNKPFEQSDYKTIIGGENIININAEFDCNLDHGYSTTVNDLVVADGKLYQANFNSVLSNGKNIQEVGSLPGKDVQYWHLTYDGEMGSIYLKDGSGYEISNPPFSATPLDKAQYPLFKKVYRYASDGKTLEDHTAEYLKANKIYNYGTTMFAFFDKKVDLIFSGEYLDTSMGFNWYRDMDWREYIAFELDLSAIGNEKPIRLFNNNIIMTDKAFYEVVYASKPLDDKDNEAQLAPDGSVSPYFPAYSHLNCNLKLRKLDLLSKYYDDVCNICTSYVITKDYKLLPIKEVITEGYNEYMGYDCYGFYWNYIDEE